MNDWFPTFQKIQQTPLRDLIRLQFSGRLNWKSRVAESDLPEVAKNRIVDVVRATRLWRLEKSQIADDLIAHFADGQNRGRDIDTMIENFGDTKTVAALMRAAKKRNRSWIWKTMVGCCYVLAAMLVFYAGVAVWFYSGKPNPTVDYLAVTNESALAVPIADQAWPIYRAAWIEHDFLSGRGVAMETMAGIDREWHLRRPGDPQWERCAQFLREHETLIEAFRQGGQKAGLGFELRHRSGYSKEDQQLLFGGVYEGDTTVGMDNTTDALLDEALIGMLLPQVQHMREMARVLILDAFRQAEMGDAENVVEDFRAMLGMANQAAEPPILVCSLVGIAVQSMAFSSLEELINRYPDLLEDQHLADITQAIATVTPRGMIRLHGERAMQKDLVQRIYSDDGDGDGRLTNEGLAIFPNLSGLLHDGVGQVPPPLLNVVGPGLALTGGSRKQLEQAMDGIMDEFDAVVGVPYYQSLNIPRDSFESLVEKHLPNDLVGRSFLELLMPATEQIVIAGERGEGQRAGVLLALAAWRFKIENDRFPNTAEELIPKFIESVPVDVLTGDPLKYRLTADGLPLIYSVGGDGDDDLGRPAIDPEGKPLEADRHFHAEDSPPVADGDWVLWPSSINSETQEQSLLESE